MYRSRVSISEIVLRARLLHVAAHGDLAEQLAELHAAHGAQAVALAELLIHLQHGAAGGLENDGVARRVAAAVAARREKDDRDARHAQLAAVALRVALAVSSTTSAWPFSTMIGGACEAPMVGGKVRLQQRAIPLQRRGRLAELVARNRLDDCRGGAGRLDERRERKHVPLIHRHRHGERDPGVREAGEHSAASRTRDSVRTPGAGRPGSQEALSRESHAAERIRRFVLESHGDVAIDRPRRVRPCRQLRTLGGRFWFGWRRVGRRAARR